MSTYTRYFVHVTILYLKNNYELLSNDYSLNFISSLVLYLKDLKILRYSVLPDLMFFQGNLKILYHVIKSKPKTVVKNKSHFAIVLYTLTKCCKFISKLFATYKIIYTT